MKLYKHLIPIVFLLITIFFVGCDKDQEYYEPLPSIDRTSMVDTIIMKVNSLVGYVGNPDIKISTTFYTNVNNDYKKPETDQVSGDTIGSILVEKFYNAMIDDSEVNKESLSYEQLRGPIWTLLPLKDGQTLKGQWTDIEYTINYEGVDGRNFQTESVDADGYPTTPVYFLEGWEETLPWTETTIKCDHTKDLNIRAVYGTDKKMYSRRVEIRVDPEPTVTYPEIIIPVIFHVVKANPIGMWIDSPEVTTEYLQKHLNDLNNAVSGKNKYPNSGQLNITFALAKYSPDGELLENEGIDEAPSATLLKTKLHTYSSSAYLGEVKEAYFNTYKSRIIWNPEQYLNIFIAPFLSTPDWPNNWLEGSEPLEGFEELEDENNIRIINRVGGIEDCPIETFTDVGILIGIKGYDMYSAQLLWNIYDPTYQLMSAIGHYFGLGPVKTFSEFLNGWDYQIDDDNAGYGNTSEQLLKLDDSHAWVSHNFMDAASETDNITVQQVHRMRQTMINCPTRGAHKVPGALTGQE